MTKKSLQLVGNEHAVSYSDPPRNLGAAGTQLWRSIQSEYDIHDAAGIEMLAQACQALTRAENLRAVVDKEGPVIKSGGVVKQHPALVAEMSCRTFVVRTLKQLGLNFEPLRAST